MSVLKASVSSHLQTESSNYFRKLYLVHIPFAQWRHIKTNCSRRCRTIGLHFVYLHAVIFCNKDELISNQHSLNKSKPVLKLSMFYLTRCTSKDAYFNLCQNIPIRRLFAISLEMNADEEKSEKFPRALCADARRMVKTIRVMLMQQKAGISWWRALNIQDV